MDRTVELGQVLQALGVGGGRTGGQAAGRPGASKPDDKRIANGPVSQLSDVASDRAFARPPDRQGSDALPEKGPLTLDRLRTIWPQLIERARTTSPMLASLLAGTEVESVEGSVVSIRLASGKEGQAEGIEHKRDAVARLVGEYVSESVRVRVAASSTAGKSVRLTPDEARAERLKALRAKDPALNAAVDALDLELLE
jgi:hypothetical protein